MLTSDPNGNPLDSNYYAVPLSLSLSSFLSFSPLFFHSLFNFYPISFSDYLTLSLSQLSKSPTTPKVLRDHIGSVDAVVDLDSLSIINRQRYEGERMGRMKVIERVCVYERERE